MTVRRYLARGDKSRDTTRLLRGVRAHVLVPIDPKSDVEKVAGWAVLADPTDLDLTAEKIFFGATVALAVRVDTLSPPAQVVKRLVAEKLRQSGRRPSRAEKIAAKDEVKKSLRSRYLPTMRATDLVWQTDTNLVHLWSHAKHANDVAVDLFARSFGLELVPLGPGLVAGRGAIPAGLEPTPELIFGFPGLPGRAASNEEVEDADA